MKKIYSFTLATALLITAFAFLPIEQQTVDAAGSCIPGESPGNLYGYAWSDEIGAIYMSTETWNDDPLGEGHATTSVDFSVTFDRQLDLWGGRGWSPVVGWVDFGGTDANLIASRRANFESVEGNPLWGGWDSIVYLSNVDVEIFPGDFYTVPGITYETDPGGFEGLAWNGKSTVVGAGPGDDEIVGAGQINFDNVDLYTELGTCDEAVNLILDGVNILYRDTCPISTPTIQWSTVDIVPGSCVTDSGFWTSPGSLTDNGSQQASGSITQTNTPVIFRVICEGAGSGLDVTGTAYASCGSPTGCPAGVDCTIDPTSGIVIPDYKEV